MAHQMTGWRLARSSAAIELSFGLPNARLNPVGFKKGNGEEGALDVVR